MTNLATFRRFPRYKNDTKNGANSSRRNGEREPTTLDPRAGGPGGTRRLKEQIGYAYDPAWNLNQRTNNALVEGFKANSG
jgi:hypothetical protein